MKTIITCSVCDKPLSGRQRLFCSSRCKNHVHQSYQAQKERALERKLYFIESMGGACVRCGYHENLSALSFHHRSGKEYELDARSLSNRGLGDMTREISKCDLLCANCHMELHHPHLDVAKLSIEPTALTTELQARMSRNKKTFRDASLIIAENDHFEKKFAENLRHYGVKPGQTIVLGVSGGVDSVTMLDLFAKSDLDLNIVVAHFNHGARESAVHDEKLVKSLAQSHNLQYEHSHILKNVRMSSTNLEEHFRNERRKFLLKVVSKRQSDYLALAHNANDQAETFVMNAVRGSGPAGLGAMSMSDGQIIRPLLNLSRAEIENYARENKLDWNEDETNKDIRYDRNYIRHRILPMLARLNPEYLANIGRSAHLQRQIDEHFKEEAYRAMEDTSCEHLRRLDKPLLYEVLGLLYEEAKGNRQNLALSHLAAIESLIKSKHGTKSIDLPGNMIARRSYDMLEICAKKEHNNSPTPSTKKPEIGRQKFGDWRVIVSPSSRPSKTGGTADKTELTIDAETLPNLLLRTRENGDKIASLGLNGTKKLQDLFVDAKIDRGKRDTWPLVVDAGTDRVIWVPGLAKAKIDNKSKKLLTIKIEEVENETTKNK